MINNIACDRILRIIDLAGQSGSGKLIAGGSRCGGDLAGGFFIAPTIFWRCRSRKLVGPRREYLEPVLSVCRFQDDDEAVLYRKQQSIWTWRVFAYDRFGTRSSRFARSRSWMCLCKFRLSAYVSHGALRRPSSKAALAVRAVEPELKNF